MSGNCKCGHVTKNQYIDGVAYCDRCFIDEIIRNHAHLTKREIYDGILELLKIKNLLWDEVYEHVRSWFDDSWPKKHNGKSLGYQQVIKSYPNYSPAKFINRFNTYRLGKYTDFDTLKEAINSHNVPSFEKEVIDSLHKIFNRKPTFKSFFLQQLEIMAKAAGADISKELAGLKTDFNNTLHSDG